MKVTLGDRVRDKITGFEGIAVVRAEYLYGCERIAIQSSTLKDGSPIDVQYFDEDGLEVVNGKEVKGSPPGPSGPRESPQRTVDPC